MMDSSKLYSLFAILVIFICSICSLHKTTAAPLGIDLDNYTPDGLDDLYPMVDMPEKRGMCRPGFTYSAILRNCMPSLGELRGRGRGRAGRRGRRTPTGWTF